MTNMSKFIRKGRYESTKVGVISIEETRSMEKATKILNELIKQDFVSKFYATDYTTEDLSILKDLLKQIPQKIVNRNKKLEEALDVFSHNYDPYNPTFTNSNTMAEITERIISELKTESDKYNKIQELQKRLRRTVSTP